MSERNGTANLLNQLSAYRDLELDYSPEVAQTLTAKNLQKHGTDASAADVQVWNKINQAALQGNMDIASERKIAEEKAATAAGTIVNQAASNLLSSDEEQEDEDEQEVDEESGELSTIDEIYGGENSEDNDEAALDDVLKIQENY